MKQILLTLTAIFLIATFSIAQNIPSYVPTNGLVGWWPFNGNANDESGNGNNLQAFGVTGTLDRFGNNQSAYSFTNSQYSVTNYLKASNISPYALNNYTISIWFNNRYFYGPGNLTFSYEQLVAFGPQWWNLGTAYGLVILDSDKKSIGAEHWTSTNGYLGVSAGNISNDSWNQIVSTYDGTSLKTYLNGVYKGSVNTGISYNGQTQFIIGGRPDGPSPGALYGGFNGSLDDIAIYNRALTQEEITSLYTGTEPCAATTSSTNLSIQHTALPYSWNGLTFNAAGSQTAHLTNSCGADSAATLNLTVTNTLPTYLPSNGLVGWWPFNGNANDESGNGNNGTVNGATLTSDRNNLSNSSYLFGIGKNIDLGQVSNLGNNPTNATYSFWINLSSLPTDNIERYPVISRRHADMYGYCWCTPNVYKSNKMLFIKECDGNTGTDCESSILYVGSWYHFVCVKKQDSLYVFQNGQLINSAYDNNSISGSPQNLIVGWQGAWNWFFDGKIDDIAIYNRALTQQEVTQLYNSCLAPFTSEFSAAGCEQYQLPWAENPVTTSGDYLHTYNTADGCDSTVTAHITINNSVAGASFNVSGINTYTLPWGDTAIQSGYYTHLYQNEFGCDSLVTAYVVINSPADSSSHNIGINVENPQRNLHIKDAIRLEPRNTPLNNPTKGDIYFDGSLNKLRVYDGTTWQNCW